MKFKPRIIEIALKKCTPHLDRYYGEFTPTEALYLISVGADLGMHREYYEDKFKACVKTGTCYIRGTTLVWFKASPALADAIKKYSKD